MQSPWPQVWVLDSLRLFELITFTAPVPAYFSRAREEPPRCQKIREGTSQNTTAFGNYTFKLVALSVENHWSRQSQASQSTSSGSLYHCPNLGPHLASSRCSHGHGGELPREATDFWEVAVKPGAETGLLPRAGYPLFTKTKSSVPVLISPQSDIDVIPWTCQSTPADTHTSKKEIMNTAFNFHMLTASLALSFPAPWGAATEVMQIRLLNQPPRTEISILTHALKPH